MFGVFHAVNVPLPALLTFAVYYDLTEVRGRFELHLEVLGPDDEPLGGGPVVVALDDPLAIAQGVAAFDGVQLRRAGTYRVRISCGGEVLAERPILVGETPR